MENHIHNSEYHEIIWQNGRKIEKIYKQALRNWLHIPENGNTIQITPPPPWAELLPHSVTVNATAEVCNSWMNKSEYVEKYVGNNM